MSNALIRLEQVGVKFAGQNVLDNIALSVEQGQIVTLISPCFHSNPNCYSQILNLLQPP